MPQGFAPRKQSSENDSCCSVPYYGPVPQEERHLFFPQKQMSAPATTRFCVSTGCKTHALLYNSALPAEGTVSGCTHDGVVVQLVRISACHVEGRGFESRPLRQNSIPLIVRSAGFSFPPELPGRCAFRFPVVTSLSPSPPLSFSISFRFETALFKATKEHCFLRNFSFRAYFYWLFGASHAYFYALFSVLHGFFMKRGLI